MNSFLTENMEWKLVKSAIGTSNINLPTNFSELLIYVNFSQLDIISTIVLDKSVLSAKDKQFRGGYGSRNEYMASFSIACTLSNIKLTEVYLNSNDVISKTEIKVMYR